MVGAKDEYLQFFSVQLNGKNYCYWSYVMKKKKLKGKVIQSYVDGTSIKITNKKDEAKYAKEFKQWDVSN